MSTIKAEIHTPIKLGRSGENMAQVVEFDVADWLAEHGDGTIVLLAQRNGDTAPYPVAIERDGSTVKWTVNSADTARTGFGKAELQLVVGEKVVKSATYSTIVQASLGGQAEEPPEPYRPWVQQVLKAGESAAQAAGAAENFATEAGIAAKQSEAAVETVEKSATEAKTAADRTEKATTKAEEAAAQAQAEAKNAATEADRAEDAAAQAQAEAKNAATEADRAKTAADRAEKAAERAEDAAKIHLVDTATGAIYVLGVDGGNLYIEEVT